MLDKTTREGNWPTSEGRLQQPSFEPAGLVKPLSYGETWCPNDHPTEGVVDPQPHVAACAPKYATRQVR